MIMAHGETNIKKSYKTYKHKHNAELNQMVLRFVELNNEDADNLTPLCKVQWV